CYSSNWGEQQGLDSCLLKGGDLLAALRHVANDRHRFQHAVRHRPDRFLPRSPLPRLAEPASFVLETLPDQVTVVNVDHPVRRERFADHLARLWLIEDDGDR